MKPRALLVLAVVVALVCLSQQALACPVCFSPKNEENRLAFIMMTGFLTCLPLGLIGSGVWWYRRRMREFERRTRASRREAREGQVVALRTR